MDITDRMKAEEKLRESEDRYRTIFETTGTATFKMILGGRWQEQTFHGTFMGKPYEGRGLLGYDNLKQELVGYWLDTMSTSASVSTGQCAGDRKSIAMSGSWDMPGETKMPFRTLLTLVSPTSMTYAMHATMGGKEMPMMELTYTKK